MGSKRHALVDGRGVPLSLLVTGANIPDCTQLAALLENKVVEQPRTGAEEENLCLDAGYRGKRPIAEMHGYRPLIRSRKEERDGKRERKSGYKARRWVVEASHSWFNRFRKLVPRYEKTDLSFVGLLHLAAALITLNKVMVIYG